MSEPGDWKCNNCFLMNFKKRDKCHKCHMSKYAKQDRSSTTGQRVGDWTCECSEHNFASRTACRKCGKQKNGEQYMQVNKYENGDWYCADTNCKELNFKVRTACRKCGKDKITQQTVISDDITIQQTTISNDNCIICMSEPKTQVITKCGHLCYCDVCGFNVDKCPICRTKYNPESDLLKIYNP